MRFSHILAFVPLVGFVLAAPTADSSLKGKDDLPTTISHGACLSALSGYHDEAYYCGHTSRFSSHCGAVFTCKNYHGKCWLGSELKKEFHEIYTVVGCGTCGNRYFDSEFAPNNCRASFNYCGNCKNVGSASQAPISASINAGASV
ncbi:hypothetical protein RUND412_010281 [Rhizina undulata]